MREAPGNAGPVTRRGLPRRVARVALRVALAAAASLVALEIGLRVAGHSPHEEAPYRFERSRGWELRPAPPETNRLGFRGTEIDARKPDGVERLAVLGDSFTYGLGVSAAEAYPAALEAVLRESRPERRVEVVNAGVPGYGTVQEAIHLEERVLPLGPDAVLLGFFLNDADAWEPPGPFGPAAFFVERHSALLRWSRILPVRIRFRSLGYRSEMDLGAADRIGDETDARWRACREAIARMARACAAAEVRFRCVVWPHLRMLDEDPFARAHARLGETLRELAVPALDLRDAFRAAPRRVWIVSEGNPHPNAEAHRLAARAIAAWLESP